jgi:hypothetical protein
MVNFEKNIEKEIKLANGEEEPIDRLQNQIRLATQIYCRANGFVNVEDKEVRKEIMLYWNDQEYSNYYSKLEKSDELKKHPRLQGNIFAITPDDILYFKEHEKLSEN